MQVSVTREENDAFGRVKYHASTSSRLSRDWFSVDMECGIRTVQVVSYGIKRHVECRIRVDSAP
jgi:hypothetical protein